MITLRADDFTEKQLAEIALAIHGRWEVPTFVKIREIVVVDEDVSARERQELNLHFERGLATIFQNLGLAEAFKFVKTSKKGYALERIPGSNLPRWMSDIEVQSRTPENVHECPHCVPPDTLILGDNKSIVEYKDGDTVIGRKGLNSVTRTYVRDYNGQVMAIKPLGMLPIIVTPEHPILISTSHTAQRRESGRLLYEISFSEERWVSAEEVVPKKSNNDGDYVVVPIIEGNFDKYEVDLTRFIIKKKPRHRGYREYFPLTEDSAWLLGLFTAEGSVTKEVRFSLNIEEEEIGSRVANIARELGYSTYFQYNREANSMLVTIPSRVLARAFDFWCGHKAPNKRIPDFVLFHNDVKITKAFIRGYEIGDSYIRARRPRKEKVYRTCSTVSKLLAQQLQLAYARLHIWGSIDIGNQKTNGIIMGRRVSLHKRYNISYVTEPNPKRLKVRFLEDRILSPIRLVRKQDYEGKIYNIETAENSYLVSNAVVHNCGRRFPTDIQLSMHTKLHYLA